MAPPSSGLGSRSAAMVSLSFSLPSYNDEELINALRGYIKLSAIYIYIYISTYIYIYIFIYLFIYLFIYF